MERVVKNGTAYLVACTPPQPAFCGQIRIAASKFLDPKRRRDQPAGLKIHAQRCKAGDDVWTQTQTIHRNDEALACDMTVAWLAPLVRFLLEDDEALFASECAHMRKDFAAGAFYAAREAFFVRQHIRIYGEPLPGDLVVISVPRTFDDRDPVYFWQFLHIAEANCMFRSHIVHGDPRKLDNLPSHPSTSNPARKVSPAALRRLPPSVLSHHGRLALLAEQAAIEAARAVG
ncbi:hypothetical protein ACOI1H_23005 [Loktanella sp. DJP18]|uniref:hypothetical protein n=1 Tax=Loktanella sp. DJP18 TaxID=3409788 RepID=UPI003BB71415